MNEWKKQEEWESIFINSLAESMEDPGDEISIIRETEVMKMRPKM